MHGIIRLKQIELKQPDSFQERKRSVRNVFQGCRGGQTLPLCNASLC